MHRTVFAGLTALDPDDQITVDGGSFLYSNTDVVDRLLQVGCVTHRHDEHTNVPNPIGQLSASVSQTGGQIPAGTSVYMGYTLLDSQGGETMLSPVVVANTQAAITPDTEPPTAEVDYTAGDLPIGGYAYAVSYRDESGGQTELQPSVFVDRAAGSPTAQVVLDGLAAGLGSGLVSWELWRADEGGSYNLLKTGTSNTFTDTGLTCTDCAATPPSVNTTNHASEIVIQLPAPEDDPGVGFATSINVYLSSDGSFSTPSLFGAYPVASGGDVFHVPALVLSAGSPPNANRSLVGAHKINPDTEISGPWKKAVANAAALPTEGNGDGDARITLNDDVLHVWNGEGKVWEEIEGGGGGGGGGSGHIIENPSGTQMPAEAKLQFTGAVEVSDDAEHSRTVIHVASGEIVDYRGAWSIGTAYKPGDAVSIEGSSYLSLTVNTGVNPTTDGGVHWGLLATAGADGRGSAAAIEWRGPWSNATTYGKFDAVSDEGGSYISLGSGNVGNQPSTHPEEWGAVALAGTGFIWRGPWSGVATYGAQDVVERGGNSYVSRIGENTGVDPLTDGTHTHWNLFVAAGKEGAAGAKGVPGASGTAGMRWRGNWTASGDYIPNDVVARGGSSLISIAPSANIGHDPQTDGFIHWQIVAARGERGASGTQGASGVAGAAGPPGTAGAKGTTGLRYRGEWESTVDYAQYDVVNRTGKYYVSASGGNVNHDPATDESHWFAFKGEGPIESKVWADRGPIEAGPRPTFPVFLGTAEESQRLVNIGYSVEQNTVFITITVNGVPVPGLENIEVAPGFKEIRMTAATKKAEEEGHLPPFALKTGDQVGMEVVSVKEGEAPIELSVTAFVEHVVWGDAESGGDHEGPPGARGPAGEDGAPGASGAAGVNAISWEAAGTFVGSGGALNFVGSGGTRVGVTEVGTGSGQVTITTVPGIAVQAASGLELHDRVMLDFTASGGAGVNVIDLGGGSARVQIGATTGGGGGTGASGIAVEAGFGSTLDSRIMLDFVGSGGTGVALEDLGGGSARITIAASGSGGGGGGLSAALFEDFSANRLGSYTPIESTSMTGLEVTEGILKIVDAENHAFVDTSVSVIDAKYIVKVISKGESSTIALVLKYINSENYLELVVFAGNMHLFQTIEGSASDLGSVTLSFGSSGDYWLVCRMTANTLRCEAWDNDPRAGGVPTVTLTETLSGEGAAKFGAGKAGSPGVRLANYEGGFKSTTTQLDSWMVVPFDEKEDGTDF